MTEKDQKDLETYRRMQEKRKVWSRAQRQALKELTHLHKEEYDQLYQKWVKKIREEQ